MLRIAALNDADKKNSDGENGVQSNVSSQQVQEAEILKQYNEALLEQRKGNLDGALEIFNSLLATPFLTKAEPVENSQASLPNGLSPIYGKNDLNIKYSCLKNLAEIHRSKRNLTTALEYYTQALELDGTDVIMWYNAGIVGSKLGLIHFAPHAFLRGVACSNQNWACLDRAAISLFIEGDFTLVMEVLGYCFKLNENYPRGLLLRDLMLETQPWLKKDMELFCPGINLLFNKSFEGPEEIREKLLKEIETLRENYQLQKKLEANKPVENVELIKPLEALTWEAVGDSLLLLRKWFVDENERASKRIINLLTNLPTMKVNVALNGSEGGKQEEPMEVVAEDVKDSDSDLIIPDRNADAKKMKRKTGSALMEELLWSGKRRSARVRSSRKEQESISVADALTNILPRKLLRKLKTSTRAERPDAKSLDEDSMDTMDLYRLFERQGGRGEQRKLKGVDNTDEEQDRDKIVENEGYFNTVQEESDVKTFLESHDKLSFVEILHAYVLAVEKLWTKTWPKRLPSIFTECYKAMRCYFPIQLQFLTSDELRKSAYEESGATLLYHELMVDSESCSEKVLPLADMQIMMQIAGYPAEFPDPLSHAIFELRLMWMRANMFLGRGEGSEAISYLLSALDCYTEHPELEENNVRLCNCRRNCQISKAIVQAALDAQSRKKSLAEVVRLYEEESFKEVTDILKEYFDAPLHCGALVREQESELVDRKTQLTMLINALYQLNEYKQCVYWLETSCYELLINTALVSSSDSEEESQEWKIEFDRGLVAIEECCELGEFKITDALPHHRLSRLVQTLCHAICKQIEDSERPPCASRPWIILNRILVALEESDESLEENVLNKDNGVDEEDEPDIPPSVLVLFTAHEYLGRREWCNCDGNVILFLIMDQVIPRFRDLEWSSFRETVQQYLDQVVFCLYAHPSKKTKTRTITDHNVAPIPLTWERGIQLFQLYRPDEIPCFDSLRINLISSDTEVLFRRIAALIPPNIDPSEKSDMVNDFIYGITSELVPSGVKLPDKVQNLFYILGDYYFKTHESAKAVNYLLMDLCANPDRVDAWASMALSKVSLLELNLNSCDPIRNEEFLKDAMAAVRCYEHCLSLDGSICTLWIEYGSFSYTVHSFCSQRMKLESDSLGLQQFEEMETTKTKMLESAKEAFINANNIWFKTNEEDRQDERWLHHYMLGKICEKYGDLSYLEHYEKASQLLYENNAQFPKKISYNAPQTLAIEAMEIYYRAHVCVIKCLELHDGEPLDEKMRSIFTKFLGVFSESPFFKQVSKADLLKQKAKEVEELEEKKQKEKDTIKSVLNGIILKIEKSQDKIEAEKAKTAEMISKIMEEIIDKILLNIVQVDQEMEIEPIVEENVKKGADEQSEDVIMSEESVLKVTEEPQQLDDSRRNSLCAEKEANEEEVIYVPSGNSDVAMSDDDNLRGLEVGSISACNQELGIGQSLFPKVVPPEMEYAATSYSVNAAGLPPNMPIECQPYIPFEPYPHEQLLDDNYYFTLDDLKKTKQHTTTQTRKKQSAPSVPSSASSESGDIAYADESSSSSSSSTSTTSSSESSSEVNAEKEPNEQNKTARPSRPPKLEPDPVKNDAESEEKVALTSTKIEDEIEVVPIEELDPEAALLQQCLSAFETCAVRFPQHYKSVYRLAHFFYRSKKHRDLIKCRQLLLGQYSTPNGNISGLFAEKKNTNFFNGIWRLPAGDVDRPGNFASHMSRSVLLLLEVLRDLRDHKLLLELCLQLRKIPEPDKRYLREDERNQLSKQALTLSLQTLRHTVRYSEVMTLPIVLDSYRVYRKVQKHYPTKEGVFSDCLLDAFNRLGKGKCTIDQCLKFCQGELTGNKIAFPSPFTSTSPKPKVKKIAKEGQAKPKAAKTLTSQQGVTVAKEVKEALPKPKLPTVKELLASAAPAQPETPAVIDSKEVVVTATPAAPPPAPVVAPVVVPQAEKVSKVDCPVVAPAPPCVVSSSNPSAPTKSLKRASSETLVKTSKEPKRSTPAPTLGPGDLSSQIDSRKTAATNLVSSGSAPFPSLPSFLQPPNTGSGSFPMFPSQPFFGFPVDYTTDAFANHYSFLTNYYARLQGQNMPEKTPKPRKPRPSAAPLPYLSTQTPRMPQPNSKQLPPPSKSQKQGAPSLASVIPQQTSISKTPLQSAKPQPSLPSAPSLASVIQQQTSISKTPLPTAKPQPSLPSAPSLPKPHIPFSKSQQPMPMKPQPTQSKLSIIKQQSPPTIKPAEPPKSYPSKPDSSTAQSLPMEPKAKFNIEDILNKNPNITVTHFKAPAVSSSSTSASGGQIEAMNLCAKPRNPADAGKRISGDRVGGPIKKTSQEPEIVTIDD